jgi:DNA mismatch repair protein MutS
MKLTPMLQQYLRIKADHQDAILLFRLGDFYEMFFEDAETAARILDITLTSRNRGDGADAVPLCGVPYHSVEPYVARLLAAGWRVAICEQRETSDRALMDREVVRVITPGSVLEEASLDPALPNRLAAIATDGARWGLAAAEFSTGAISVTESGSWATVLAELERLEVREVVVPETIPAEVRQALGAGPWVVSPSTGPPGALDDTAAWCRRWPQALGAAALVHGYLAYAHRGALDHLRAPEPYEIDGHLAVDAPSRRNLELTSTLGGERRGSLLWVLDRSATPMGARTLRQWMLAPLLAVDRIGGRLDAVEELLTAVAVRERIGEALRGMGDLERIAGRIGAGRATPRDVVSLGAALGRVERLCTVLAAVQAPLLRTLAGELDSLPAIRDLVGRALVDDPPANARAGRIIRAGYHREVDALRESSQDGRGWIAALESRERGRTGIGSLKVRYNKVFGYYIEVSKANLKLVPGDYERKQTLVGSERYVTPELKDYETKVLGADERLRELQLELFAQVVAELAAAERALGATARAVGTLDVLTAFAEVAHRRNYVRPVVRPQAGLHIVDGRHPVVEALLPGGAGFVPNDCDLDAEHGHILILTGPNMAGKSTYLRQVALIVLMAQMGSFVPAAEASIGTVDQIFTRVGAADNLAGGESTFMVEMRETANILANVTSRSLVILDEIGRGTSTYDGISIAWAVVEHLYAGARPLTLFATHYHELTDIPRSCPGVRNAAVAVREWKGEVVFLRRVVPGPASRSYGIEVARLAGVPPEVVARAKELLASLEEGSPSRSGCGGVFGGKAAAEPEQGSLFEPAGLRLQRELAGVDLDQLTPLEALNYLGRLVDVARSGG